jgi:hypothetical protein
MCVFTFWVQLAGREDDQPNLAIAKQLAGEEYCDVVREERRNAATELWLFMRSPNRFIAARFLARLLGHKLPYTNPEAEYLLTYLGY